MGPTGADTGSDPYRRAGQATVREKPTSPVASHPKARSDGLKDAFGVSAGG